jgi:hypothetical protein
MILAERNAQRCLSQYAGTVGQFGACGAVLRPVSMIRGSPQG